MKKIRILYIEDNPGDILLLKSAFKLYQFDPELIVIQDGVGAIDFLRRQKENLTSRIDAILLDLNLPNKNGFEVLQEMREFNIFGQIPIIVVSGTSNVRDECNSLKMGATAFLQKPNQFEQFGDFIQEVKRHLEHHFQVQQK
jgi:chemotaxis family two-component system response regulator Rcp1